jgi:hypothetical protein
VKAERRPSGHVVEHRLAEAGTSPPRPRSYELFVRREGRTDEAVAYLADLVHADLTGEIDLEGALGASREAVVHPSATTSRDPHALRVSRVAEITTSYGKVEMLEVRRR